jgi:hypothetical protein
LPTAKAAAEQGLQKPYQPPAGKDQDQDSKPDKDQDDQSN